MSECQLCPHAGIVLSFACLIYLRGRHSRKHFSRCRMSMNLCRVHVCAGNVLLVKGAAECVLDRCDRVMLPDGKVVKLTPALRSSILSCVDEMADNALRILALARRWVGTAAYTDAAHSIAACRHGQSITKHSCCVDSTCLLHTGVLQNCVA